MTLLYLLITISIIYVIICLYQNTLSLSQIFKMSRMMILRENLNFIQITHTRKKYMTGLRYLMYDGICFSEKMYHEQYVIVMSISNRNNSYINTIFIDGECTPHLPLMFNFEKFQHKMSRNFYTFFQTLK